MKLGIGEIILEKLKVLTTENVSNIKYKISKDEDRTTITGFIDGDKVGSITFDILFDAYQYEFEDDFDEDDFDKMFPHDVIVKIEHIEIEDDYKNEGIGTELMKYGMEIMKKKGYKQFYLNASPMGFSGLRISDLIKFYKKFKFKVILNQGNNALMKLVL